MNTIEQRRAASVEPVILVPRAVRHDREFGATEKFLYVVLADLAGDTSVCPATDRELADQAGMGRSTVANGSDKTSDRVEDLMTSRRWRHTGGQ
jgi:hypothetical protein